MHSSTSLEPPSDSFELSQSAVRALAACARAPQLCPDLGFEDVLAECVFSYMNEGNIFFPDDWLRTSARRAAAMDALVHERLATLPRGTPVIGIGSVLSTRAHRFSGVRWLDVDVLRVASLRSRLLPPRPDWKQLAVDDWQQGWLRDVLARDVKAHDRSVLFLVDEAWLPFDEVSLSSLLEQVCLHAPARSELLLAIDAETPIQRAPGPSSSPALEIGLPGPMTARFPRLRFAESEGASYDARTATSRAGIVELFRIV